MAAASNGTGPEFYLCSTDMQAELGISEYQLRAMCRGAGIVRCINSRCRYRKEDLRRLREAVSLRNDYGVSPTAAGRMQAKFEVRRAAKELAAAGDREGADG